MFVRHIAVTALLAVEKNKIDSISRPEIADVVPELHEQGHAAPSVVGADKLPAAGRERVRNLIRKRPRIVVTTEQDPLLGLRVPGDDEVAHPHRLAIEGVSRIER